MTECPKCHAGPANLYEQADRGYVFGRCVLCAASWRVSEPPTIKLRPVVDERANGVRVGRNRPRRIICRRCQKLVEVHSVTAKGCGPCRDEFKREKQRAKYWAARQPTAEQRLAHEMTTAGAFAGSRAARGQ